MPMALLIVIFVSGIYVIAQAFSRRAPEKAWQPVRHP